MQQELSVRSLRAVFPQIMMTVPRDQRPNEEPYYNVSEKFVGLVKALTPANGTSQPYRRARTTSLYHQGPYHQPLPPGPVPPPPRVLHQGYCTEGYRTRDTAPKIYHPLGFGPGAQHCELALVLLIYLLFYYASINMSCLAVAPLLHERHGARDVVLGRWARRRGSFLGVPSRRRVVRRRL